MPATPTPWFMTVLLLPCPSFSGLVPAPLLRNCDCEVGPLRGADKAMGNRLEPVRLRAFARSQLGGILAGDIAEHAAERAQAVPAGLEGNIGDRCIGVAQQRLGPFDPARQQVAMRRHAERG